MFAQRGQPLRGGGHGLLEFGHAGLQRGAGLGVEDGQGLGSLLLAKQVLLDPAGLEVGALRDPAVDVGAGHALQQVGALVALGAQKGRKVALRQQHGAAELVEGQADDALDGGQHLGLVAADGLLGLLVQQLHLDGLQLAAGGFPRAPHRPARAIAPPVGADKAHLGMAAARAAAQQVARVADAQVVVGPVRDLVQRILVEPGRAVVQRQAQRVQQRALAGAGGAGDGKQARLGQRAALEIELEVARQAGQVAPTDLQDLHAAPASAWASPVSWWKASTRPPEGSPSCERAQHWRSTCSGCKSSSEAVGSASASACPWPV